MQHKGESYQWGVWRMDESYDDLCHALRETSLPQEAEQRFSSRHRREEWLSVRLLLKQLLGEQKQIAYHPSGKPYLSDNSFQISISHTKGYVAVIFGKTEVGIDIEQYGERVHKVAHKYVREDESLSLYQGTDTWDLLLRWSAKEVMFKCLDCSEVDFRQHLFIPPFTLSSEGEFPAQEFRTEKKQTFRIHYLLHPDFVLTWQAAE